MRDMSISRNEISDWLQTYHGELTGTQIGLILHAITKSKGVETVSVSRLLEVIVENQVVEVGKKP
jgi:hypothetical protein